MSNRSRGYRKVNKVDPPNESGIVWGDKKEQSEKVDRYRVITRVISKIKSTVDNIPTRLVAHGGTYFSSLRVPYIRMRVDLQSAFEKR